MWLTRISYIFPTAVILYRVNEDRIFWPLSIHTSTLSFSILARSKAVLRPGVKVSSKHFVSHISAILASRTLPSTVSKAARWIPSPV